MLLEVEVIEGELECPESGRKFPIKKGIPDMRLNEDEVWGTSREISLLFLTSALLTSHRDSRRIGQFIYHKVAYLLFLEFYQKLPKVSNFDNNINMGSLKKA